MRRVAITGYGIQSCLGNTREEVAAALEAGRSGIVLYPERKALGFRSALGGALRDPPELPFPRKTVRQMGPSPKIAAYAALQAIEHAALPEELVRGERTAMIIGHGGCMQDVYQQCSDFESGKTLAGTALQRVMCDTVSANLSILFGTRGFSFTVSAACATGAAAIGQAYQLIQWGLQDRALCGGAMESTWEFASHFDALKALSLREDAPEKASRPFDRGRDGLVPSGGGSILVLEEWEAARARGAPIRAELVGYCFTSDAHDMTAPSGEGGLRAMRGALEQGGLAPGDVDYVNAHATSTPVGDVVEARSIEQLFVRGGEPRPAGQLDQVDDRPRVGRGGQQRAGLHALDDGARLRRAVDQHRGARPGMRRDPHRGQHRRAGRDRPRHQQFLRVRRGQHLPGRAPTLAGSLENAARFPAPCYCPSRPGRRAPARLAPPPAPG